MVTRKERSPQELTNLDHRKGEGKDSFTDFQQNGQQEKTKTVQCMEEVQAILDKYKCEIVCIPQKMYGQTIYAPMIAEIK